MAQLDLVQPQCVQGIGLDRFRTLALNSDYRPISTAPLSLWSWRKSVEAVYKGAVQVVEEWEDTRISSQKISMPIPKVVVFNSYVKENRRRAPTLSRFNCALRDGFRCGYCGKGFVLSELTFDHVIPRSKGGKTTWDNILMSCSPCNLKKGSSMVNYNGIRGEVKKGNFVPLARPKQPTIDELYSAGLSFIPKEVRAIFDTYLPQSPARTRANEVPDLTMGNSAPWNDLAYWTDALER